MHETTASRTADTTSTAGIGVDCPRCGEIERLHCCASGPGSDTLHCTACGHEWAIAIAEPGDVALTSERTGSRML